MKPNVDEVMKAVDALQAKYPMVYIAAWYPEDFEHAAGNTEDDGCINIEVDYKNPLYSEIVNMLHDEHDAMFGINWGVIEDAYNRCYKVRSVSQKGEVDDSSV